MTSCGNLQVNHQISKILFWCSPGGVWPQVPQICGQPPYQLGHVFQSETLFINNLILIFHHYNTDSSRWHFVKQSHTNKPTHDIMDKYNLYTDLEWIRKRRILQEQSASIISVTEVFEEVPANALVSWWSFEIFANRRVQGEYDFDNGRDDHISITVVIVSGFGDLGDLLLG